MKVAFHTLGCKVNQYETEAMKEQFIMAGFDIVSEEEKADVYVINTCTVTNIADRKSRQYIRKMKTLSPEAVIAVLGCYSQVKPEELAGMREVDIVMGNGEKNTLIYHVLSTLKLKSKGEKPETLIKVLPYESLTEYNDHGIIKSMDGKTRAYIKIEEGCDRFCSYCLIPFARGSVRSRNQDEIIEEARMLINNGFKEIVLTGINTALYDDLAGIIERINDIPGDFRIRLSSLEPTVVNSEYVKKLLKYEKLCHHLHLSIQSGSDRVIKNMNRNYTRDDYIDIVKVLRNFDPGYGITTDIIVGFPGESEEDFKESLSITDLVKFGKVHTFKYSKRKGTKAEKLPEQIDGNTKNERSDRLIEAGEKSSIEFRKSLIGTIRAVLFEEENSEKTENSGYTDNYVKVYTTGDGKYLNELKKVRLIGIYKDGMKGEVIDG